MFCWIETISYNSSDGYLRELYDQVKTPHGTVDNVMKAHSLRPHTMAGHLTLYKSVLHNPDNALPLWFLETVAVYTSLINDCAYSFAHHFNNVRNLVGDDDQAAAIERSLRDRKPEDVFEGKELALLRYTAKLTASPGAMVETDIEDLHAAGAEDGEILEVNQVCAYFNYSNRLLNGLGVTTQGDVIGYYSADEPG
jgi:uncharacterized peroxidase-related enzyme